MSEAHRKSLTESSRGLVRYVFDRLPYIGELRRRVAQQGLYDAGHYYSPVPAREDITRYLSSTDTQRTDYQDIDLRTHEQFALLQEFQRFYADLPFRDEPTERCRYSYNQTVFCYADAIFLYSFLRHTQPRRIIEVGSGYSSAVMLDTNDLFFARPATITCIEPYPDRLRQILRPVDHGRLEIIEKPVQHVPWEVFARLEPNDLLFIDSSHVVKAGNDVQYLLFEVLPRLPVGVFVHFHDIWRGFEYPEEWLRTGMYWNEAYVVRAFLAYNSDWEIHFFNNYAGTVFAEYLAKEMPLCLKNIGGSLYLRRRQASNRHLNDGDADGGEQ